jgi:soluble cytochrome b562
VALVIAGCGGGGDAGASKKDYAASLNTFCSSVKGAAQQVQKDAAKVQASGGAKTPKQAVKTLAGPLATYATSTKAALDKFRTVKAPSDYADYQKKAVSGFDSVIAKLNEASSAAQSGDLKAITALGTSLSEVKLPTLPASLKDTARACADIAS